MFQADCFRCGTQLAAFSIQNQILHTLHPKLSHYDLFATCGVCGCGSIFVFSMSDRGDGDPKKYIAREGFAEAKKKKLVEVLPRPLSTDAPNHTPKRVADLFRQAKKSEGAKSWDAAGMTYRKALEIGLNNKFPDLTDSWTPYKKIQTAAKEHKLTLELAKWAHQIRALGNTAAHEEVFTADQAREMAAFTEIMLQYMFTLPGDLAAAQTSATKRQKDADPLVSRGGGAQGSR